MADKRTTLVEHAAFTIAHNASIGYPGGSIPFRPMPWMEQSMAGLARLFAEGNLWYPDCSAYVTWLFKWSGMGDPTGNGFNGTGNSGAMWSHLKHYYEPSHAKPGAIIVFGDAGDIHACVVIESGSNPWLASHGSAAGPIRVRYSDECAAHAGQKVTFLDVTPLLGG